MRVTDNYKFESFKNSVLTLQKKLQRNQDQVSSQKKILAPSDDPVGTSQYIQLTAQQGRNEQYVKTLDRLTTLSGMWETAETNIADVLTQAKQLAVNMASDTVDAETRKSAVSEVEGMMEQLVTIGNSSISGTYIFGGKKTDLPPFTLDKATYTVTYNGTSDVPQVNVAAGQTVNLGMAGNKVFGSGTADIFTALKDMRTALINNDRTGIQHSLDTVDAAVNLTSNNLSYIGTYSRNIENLGSLTGDNTLQLQTNISKLMDVDMISALSDYNLLSTAYETALTVMGKMQSLNILNYLKF
ncbi:MAG TPA: flagellar hook-associated protein FlgL [Syntrophorhabdaceae bacterium]|jgi:flagellar hook-associated protein 3 FlgL